MDQTITTFTDAESRDRTLYAFLAEKERRSGSRRTVEGYARMLRHFFLTVGCPPDRVTGPEAFAWAYGIGLSEAAVIGFRDKYDLYESSDERTHSGNKTL